MKPNSPPPCFQSCGRTRAPAATRLKTRPPAGRLHGMEGERASLLGVEAPDLRHQRRYTRTIVFLLLGGGLVWCAAALYRRGPASTPQWAQPATQTTLDFEAGGLKTTVAGNCLDRADPVLNGADVIAYRHIEGGWVQGDEEFSSSLNGFTFWFETAENLRLFESDPWHYAPRYGAFCSWGVAEEDWWTKDALGPSADPSAWLLIHDQLFLFRSQTPLEKFSGDVGKFMKDGDHTWASWWGGLVQGSAEQPFNTGCLCSPATCEDA